MIEKAKDASANLINAFSDIYPINADISICILASAFIGCYSMMDNIDRARIMMTILQLTEQVGSENFEDGHDFLDFLKERFPNKTDEKKDET